MLKLSFPKWILTLLLPIITTQVCLLANEFWSPVSNSCVKKCPWESPNKYYADSQTKMCVKICPSIPKSYADDFNQVCTQTCPWDATNTSKQTYYDQTYRKCVLNCPSIPSRYKSLDLVNRTCLQYCEAGSYALDSTRSCVPTCPANTRYFVNNSLNIIQRKCVSQCPNNTFEDNLLFCVKSQNCPSDYYGDRSSGKCVQNCPIVGGAQTYSDKNILIKMCVYVCPTNFYAQNLVNNMTCVSQCLPNNFIDNVTKSCVIKCSNNSYSYSNGKCIGACPSPYFADPLENKCDLFCTGAKFADSTTRMCVNICPYGYYGEDYTDVVVRKRCVAVCSNLLEFGDPLKRICVQKESCSTPYLFADMKSRQCVIKCPESQDTFGLLIKNQCVQDCPWDAVDGYYYRDKSSQRCVLDCPNNPSLFKYNVSTPICVTTCPDPYFAVISSRFCQPNCPSQFYADSTTHKCVSKCPQDPVQTFFNPDLTSPSCVLNCSGLLFADPTTLTCIPKCPSKPSLFGYNNKCIQNCPTNFFQNPTDRTCDGSCTGLTSEDSTTNRCVNTCPSFPSLYSYANKCISICPDTFFSDNSTRKCTQICNASIPLYAYTPTKQCLPVCINNTYSHQGVCISSCLSVSQFIDTTTVSCVTTCPDYYFKDFTLGQCVLDDKCSNGLYADPIKRQCVSQCDENEMIFKDNTTMKCVKECPYGQYGDYSDVQKKLCVLDCPPTYFKDDSIRRCVLLCSTLPATYADTHSKKCVPTCRAQFAQFAFSGSGRRQCVTQCPNISSTQATYADNHTRRCLPECLLIPSTYQYVDGNIKKCVLECPQPFLSDNTTRSCVPECPTGYFAHWPSRTCVSSCPQYPGQILYADNSNKQCVSVCSSSSFPYMDDILRTCVAACSGRQFSDNSTGECVDVCPDDPDYFGQIDIKICVFLCDSNKDLFADNSTRQCVLICPEGSFADPITQRCVKQCSKTDKLYADQSTHTCILQCPSHPSLYADNITQSCVQSCPNDTFGNPITRFCQQPEDCPVLYFADEFSKLCVQQCPELQGTYAENDTKRCLNQCPTPSFADNSTRVCIDVCSVQYFGFENKCVSSCPLNFYANNINRLCEPSSQCPSPTVADPTSQKCVPTCPYNYYADLRPAYLLCVQTCPENYYADDFTKTCVLKCPSSNNTFGTNSTRKCVQTCPFGQFAQNITRFCVARCWGNDVGDPSKKLCVIECPTIPNLYAVLAENMCVDKCPSTPDLYADDLTRVCVPQCPTSQGTFADSLTRRCVKKCPVSMPTFADSQTKKCEQYCYHDATIKTYADPSTQTCVPQCPTIPPLYADLSTFKCVLFCPNSTIPRTFTDNSTRICEPICSSTSLYFSTNSTGSCVTQCPGGSYADLNDRACVQRCSGTNDAYNYGDDISHKCINQCPVNFYAQNLTRKCSPFCPINQYADTHKRRCVKYCDGLHRQYADNTTNKCVDECPQTPDMFADNLTYTCVIVCPPEYWASNITRQCVQDCQPMFSDNSTGRCVQNCPSNLLTYADTVTHSCVLHCPAQSGPNPRTFADDSTKRCVPVCPTSPWTYAENTTRICVYRCPEQTYGENTTRQCVSSCASWNTFGDNKTNFCVTQCSENSFADSSTFLCVQNCPDGTFADNSTWQCVPMCPSNPQLFGDQTENICVINCPNQYYGDELSRKCVQQCPTSPVYYAHQPTKRCLQNCLFPYFGQPDIQECVPNCYWGQYGNITTHLCTVCPINCTSCVSELACQTCSIDYFLFNGTCVFGYDESLGFKKSDCPINTITNRVTYASPISQSCVQSCQEPYYGFNTTLHCILTCPINFYPSQTTRRCELCINGCNNCTNSTFCYSCYPNYLFSNNYCVEQCSATLPFFYGTSCLSACIDGTYLMYDAVTCNNCSSTCATCSILATNCTRCVGAFLFNFNCVSKCPTNYYSNSVLVCVPCTPTTQQCNIPPLTYTLTTNNKNGQLFALLEFNRDVFMDISKISQIINISINGISNSYYRWTVTRVDAKTYQIDLNVTLSLNQMALSLVFLNPALVVDSLGTIITATSVQATMPSYDYISPEDMESTLTVSSFSGIISYVALAIIVILLFKGSYPLLFVFEVFQNVYFHYFIIAELPYNFSNYLLNLKYLNFQFLPSLFNLMIPSDYSSPATPQKFKLAITDTTFFISAGHYFLVIAFYVVWALIISLLKTKQLNKFKKVRKFARNVYQNRIRFGALNECIWYCFMTFVFFGLWQFYDTTFTYQWSKANFALAMICLFGCIFMVLWVIFLVITNRNSIETMHKKFLFIIGDDSTIPYEMALRYIRKLLLCLFLFSATIELQIVGMIASNFLVLAFYAIYRPSKSVFSNIVNLFIELCYIGLELTIIFYVNVFDISSDQKLVYGLAMISFASIALILVVIWLIWNFIQFLYGFKFVREIVEETKLANKIYPEQDNLKVEFDKDFNQNEIVSQSSGISIYGQNQRNFNEDEDTIVGIQKQNENNYQYHVHTPNSEDTLKVIPKTKNGEQKRSKEQRFGSSRQSSRNLFADLSIEDLE